jgi:hypothetical protein
VIRDLRTMRATPPASVALTVPRDLGLEFIDGEGRLRWKADAAGWPASGGPPPPVEERRSDWGGGHSAPTSVAGGAASMAQQCPQRAAARMHACLQVGQ